MTITLFLKANRMPLHGPQVQVVLQNVVAAQNAKTNNQTIIIMAQQANKNSLDHTWLRDMINAMKYIFLNILFSEFLILAIHMKKEEKNWCRVR